MTALVPAWLWQNAAAWVLIFAGTGLIAWPILRTLRKP